MIRIAVVVGSTRPGRRGESVARWVADTAAGHPAVTDGRAMVEVSQADRLTPSSAR